MPLKSVRKRWKQRAFAAGVDREHVAEVTVDFSRERFGRELEFWQHAGNLVAAIQDVAAELELDGRLARQRNLTFCQFSGPVFPGSLLPARRSRTNGNTDCLYADVTNPPGRGPGRPPLDLVATSM